MGKIILSVLFNIVSISLCFAAEVDKPKLFIMLNVDNTIIDRIAPENVSLMKKLTEQGYIVQETRV